MPDLMREYGFQFRFGQLRHQCIEENDFPEPSEPDEERIRMTRSFAAVHDLDVSGAKASSLRKAEEPFAQSAIGQRREFVEQRKNQHRREHGHEKLKCE